MITSNYQTNLIDRRRRQIQRRISSLQHRFQSSKYDPIQQRQPLRDHQRVLNQKNINQIRQNYPQSNPHQNIQPRTYQTIYKPLVQATIKQNKPSQLQKLFDTIESTIKNQNNIENQLIQLKNMLLRQSNKKHRQKQGSPNKYGDDKRQEPYDTTPVDKLYSNYGGIKKYENQKQVKTTAFNAKNNFDEVGKIKHDQKDAQKQRWKHNDSIQKQVIIQDIKKTKQYNNRSNQNIKQKIQKSFQEESNRQSPNKYDFLRQYLTIEQKAQGKQQRNKSMKNHSKRPSNVKQQLTQNIKVQIAGKIQNRLRQSQQNYQDSYHKNAKHQHHHLLNTFQLQKKLRDDLVRRIYEMQDIKRYK